MPYQYISTKTPLGPWEAYLKNPALLHRRSKLERIIRRREILGQHSPRRRCPSAELLGLLGALSEAMPRRRHFRTAYRLIFLKN